MRRINAGPKRLGNWNGGNLNLSPSNNWRASLVKHCQMFVQTCLFEQKAGIEHQLYIHKLRGTPIIPSYGGPRVILDAADRESLSDRK